MFDSHEAFAEACAEHLLTPETRAAICACVQAEPELDEPIGIVQVAKIARALGANTNAVLAYFGFVPTRYDKNAFNDAYADSTPGSPEFPEDDMEAMACIALRRTVDHLKGEGSNHLWRRVRRPKRW